METIFKNNGYDIHINSCERMNDFILIDWKDSGNPNSSNLFVHVSKIILAKNRITYTDNPKYSTGL